ncbi:MAG: CRTAC1 family protein [Deltaproteobacteria bacterium]|nr:CRTAC1 family protein [Deltaproteobacteria bacterium]
MRRLGLSSLCFLLACGGGSSTPDAGDAAPADANSVDASPTDAAPMDASAPDAARPTCNSGLGELPPDVVTLSRADETGTTDLSEQSFSIDVDGSTLALAEQDLYEAVRFSIDRPARVLGFGVRWGSLDAAPAADAELRAGVYPDFGHNGFDFWRWDPFADLSRCASDARADEWIDYVLPSPVVVTQPGLLYVAHERVGTDAPAFRFDQTPADSCDAFAACSSSINLFRAGAGSFTGTTFPFQYDYEVRLYVQYTEDAPTDLVFRELPDSTLGNRVAFGDYDGDGFDDFVTAGPKLMRGAGDGTFTDVTAASGIGAMGVSGSGVWGDYDNDGCLDLFVFAESMTQADALLHANCDGTFTDVTAASGIGDLQSYEDCGDAANVHAPTPAAAFADLDADGLVDLYVGNFICWGRGSFYSDQVWHNEGDGTFSDWSGTHGFSDARTPSRSVAPADADGDGDIDILVGNYRLVKNLYFRGIGGGEFLEEGRRSGLEGHADARGGVDYFGHTIGVAWGDLDNDGDLDVVEANLAHPRFFDFSDKTRVLLNDGRGHFLDTSGDWSTPASDAGLRYQETHSSPVLADFDADGNLDLVITEVYDGRPTDFYWGSGDGRFRLDVLHSGITTTNGWGAAASDWDNDGDMDLAATTLFENQRAGAHFLELRVVGDVASNRYGLGATVTLTVGGVSVLRHVSGGSGQGCQDSATLHFGLGDSTRVDSIRVTFIGGGEVRYAGPFDADQRLWLYESGRAAVGWSEPPVGAP